ncbi:porin [Rhodobacter capsulatus]|uniref:porin n=1 Tax=Rhodobacter capsulatus TaxID=1061 RepID=UPI004029324B
MKKLLIATTALVMTAGMAAAEVKLSGDARMGVAYAGGDGVTDNEWNFSSRARVKFTLSGTTDTGLEFGATFKTSDLRGEDADPRNGSRGTVFLSGAFGKVTMGDVASAPEELFGDLADVGYLGDDQGTAGITNGALNTNDIPYLTLDNQTQSALLYTYSTGPISVAAAMSDGYTDQTTVEEAQAYSVAAAYTFGNYTAGLGYEKLDGVTAAGDKSQTELAGMAKFGNTDVKAYYAAGGDENLVDYAVGLSVASAFNAVTVKGYVQKASPVDGADIGGGADESVTWYGLGADYDLGGGAILAAGVQDDDVDGSDPVANLGVKFSF